MDHNQGRRGHFHRGRRGPDRRGPERRQVGPPPETQNNRPERNDRVDVEQIMREIRSRIAQRSGVELSNQQIQELAARRLEAILDPRGLNPALLDQLRRGAGERTSTPDAAPQPEAHPFDEATLYDSPNGLLRFLRRLLNPILRLFINPTPIAHSLALQSRFDAELAAREAERDRRQTEWNALHYQILQRLVMEVSRVSIEEQSQSLRIESLGAKVDFNERRVRTMEGTQVQVRPPRPQETAPAAPQGPQPAAAAESGSHPSTAATEGATGDQPRRRRRRRRGRRSPAFGGPSDATAAAAGAPAAEGGEDVEGDTDEGFEDEPSGPEPSEMRADPAPSTSDADTAPVHQMPAQPEAVAHQDAAPAPSPIQPPPIEPSEG